MCEVWGRLDIAYLTLVWCLGLWDPFSLFNQRKNYTINIFFKLRLNGLGSLSMKTIYQNKFSMTTYCTPPYTLILHKGSSGPLDLGVIKVLLLSGPAINMCICICVCVCVCVCV